MNRALNDANLVRKYAPSMGGVFSTGDLCALLDEATPVLLHRRVNALVEGAVVARFSRGVYVSPDFDPGVLASRIIDRCYLSLGTVLARELMIGSVPARTVYAVRVGRNRTFAGPGLTIEYVGIDESLFFGYEAHEAVRYATPEKALLDTLYFHLRGRRFSFDIYQDIDIARIDRGRVREWLTRYRNPRYVSFVKGYLDDRS
jgi:hypothetical protein